MCYTIQKNLTREELERRFGVKYKPNRPYSPGKRVSAFTFPEIPVICTENVCEIDSMNWGLVPFWAKTEKDALEIRKNTINARLETLQEKPSFRHTLKNQRCLVLANGYYEWQHVGKKKIPYYIQLKNDKAMPMAGLYDSWTNKQSGEIWNTFTIITTRANALMEEIHNTKKRMPVILTCDAEKAWIDPASSAEKALEYLTQIDSDLILATKLDENNNSQPSLF